MITFEHFAQALGALMLGFATIAFLLGLTALGWILAAGVAGLQAIGTARRLGAVVQAFVTGGQHGRIKAAKRQSRKRGLP